MSQALLRNFIPAALWLALCLLPGTLRAQSEIHLQLGRLVNPFSGEQARTRILTYQYAGSWALGENYLFVDFLDDDLNDGFNDQNFYTEWYPTVNLSNLQSREPWSGAVRDVGFIAGINAEGDPDVLKLLPGLRLSWNVPGFVFFNTDYTLMLDRSDGLAQGGAPATGDQAMFDISWGKAFTLGGHAFWFTGHIEYISGTYTENGARVRDWILAQPQLGWDLGKWLFNVENQLFLGIEYQYWKNKLGANESDNTPQLWVMWRI